MEKYQIIIGDLRNNNSEKIWNQLFSELQNQGKNIVAFEGKNQSQNSLYSLIRNQTLKPRENWFIRLNQMIVFMYEKKKELLKILHRALPVLMLRYIQINHVKYEGLEECLITIYNFEYKNFNEAQIDKTELSKDVAIRNLYDIHLGKQMVEPIVQTLQPIVKINNPSRVCMKSLIFHIIYREAAYFGDQSLNDYYRSLFIYCGADQKDINNTGSLYLLERTNKVSIFRYSISEEELQWIILTLYELCVQVKKDKFQLLAVINIIHKKVSNECLFRLSDVANSLIHLLEDQYSEIFI